MRERGYSAEVVEKSDRSYDDREWDFFLGRPLRVKMRAPLISDAEEQRFEREVHVHHGFVIGYTTTP